MTGVLDASDENEMTAPPPRFADDFDPVAKPAGYTQGEIECIDAERSMLTAEEFRGSCKAQALQYLWREKHKGGDEDLRKAIWWLRMATGDDPRAER